ncbi:hypothetical protein FRC14_006459 [Serendipita sp. 396]|nr:hypothetical protein FRC14_006459 [Serendipita sp. 396]
MFEGGNWDVRRSVWARVHWPLETNACDLPLSQVLAARTSQIQAQEKKPSASQMPLLVHPSILRVYSYRYEDTPKLVDLLGPYLNTILFQGEFRSVRWTKQCESVVKYCPNLQKLLLLHCFTKGVHSTLHWEVAPVSHLYVLEHQDWHITRTSGSNLGDTNPLPVKLDEVLLESELENAERDLSDGDLVETASHLVIFGEEYCESHTRPVYRKPMVFDKRWPSEAFGAGEETRDAKTLAKGFAHDWSAPLIPLPVNIIVALKQPGTVPTPWDG